MQVKDLVVTGQAIVVGDFKCPRLDEALEKVINAITVFSGDAAPTAANIDAEDGDIYLQTS